jgi:signal peptidase I
MSETTDLKRNANGIVETVKVVVQALLLALVVRTFFYQPFNIPSGSMKSTLLVGDYLFVSKFSYGYSQYSIPYAAIPFSGRIFGSEPQRGDVAVFKLPRDNETDYIKRVIEIGRAHV